MHFGDWGAWAWQSGRRGRHVCGWRSELLHLSPSLHARLAASPPARSLRILGARSTHPCETHDKSPHSVCCPDDLRLVQLMRRFQNIIYKLESSTASQLEARSGCCLLLDGESLCIYIDRSSHLALKICGALDAKSIPEPHPYTAFTPRGGCTVAHEPGSVPTPANRLTERRDGDLWIGCACLALQSHPAMEGCLSHQLASGWSSYHTHYWTIDELIVSAVPCRVRCELRPNHQANLHQWRLSDPPSRPSSRVILAPRSEHLRLQNRDRVSPGTII
ncbi:hypothetical protein TcWFU_001694 [Taenia crassiceps]|uniref:Uncharacterized protein n=1 Tax=Taenia crassiceps TaxID=6207 RepID=A0ABR4QPF3_9CEST